MSVRSNAPPRGMIVLDRIRLTGSFAVAPREGTRSGPSFIFFKVPEQIIQRFRKRGMREDGVL